MERILALCGTSGEFIIDVAAGIKSFKMPKDCKGPAGPSVPNWARGRKFFWLGKFDRDFGMRIFEPQ